MNKLLANNRELYFFSCLGLILLFFLVISLVLEQKVRRDDISIPSHIVSPEPFENINLTAKAAYVYDVRGGKTLFSLNENDRLPLASLTKVMSALIALEAASPESTIAISEEAIRAEGDTGLYLGERWNLKDLIDFSLTTSSNDGMKAVALAIGSLDEGSPEAAFIARMNTKADELGMKNTYYFNETGLDETMRKGGAYGTARDMAILYEYILKTRPDLFEATRERYISTSSIDAPHAGKNTNFYVEEIPGIKASKTGFTDIAGGNLVIAFDPEIGRPIIVSVLGSTQDERFTDVEKLVDATLKAIQDAKSE